MTRNAPPEPVAKAAKAARIDLPGVVAHKAPPAPKTAYAAAPQPPPLQKAMPKAPSSNAWPKVVSKVPPVASPAKMQEREDVLDDRLRFIALRELSVLNVRDDFELRNPTSRDCRPMDLHSQGADYDWLDRYRCSRLQAPASLSCRSDQRPPRSQHTLWDRPGRV